MIIFGKTASLGRYLVLVILFTSVFHAGSSHAEEGAGSEMQFNRMLTSEKTQSGTSSHGVAEYLPEGDLYAPYAADLNRVNFALELDSYTKVTIPDSGAFRFDLRAGGQFGLVRINPTGTDYPAWQANIQGGFNAQFDIQRHLDDIGWDGWYGLLLTSAQTKHLSLRFGYLHDSSHVGDEYAQRTGRLRIGYTREELAAGASWVWDSSWRTYAEYAYAIHMGNHDLQRPGRAKWGVEWQPSKPVKGFYRGWYAAGDFNAWQEREWRIDTSLQAGYRIDTVSKTWRVGLDWYNGRPPIGEFFQYTERYLGIGLWIDI